MQGICLLEEWAAPCLLICGTLADDSHRKGMGQRRYS